MKITKEKIYKRFYLPKGITNIVITIMTMLLVVVSMGLLSYWYLQLQPDTTVIDGGIVRAIEEWHGIEELSEPVDTIIMGDSVALYNFSPGPFADRLGGRVLKLGNNAASSFLMDAWMLNAYIDRFGPPRNVIIVRSTVAYSYSHSLEYMQMMPLSWGFWNDYGVSPDWKKGELLNLWINKYLVLYSDIDILRDRISHPQSLFDHTVKSVQPTNEYVSGDSRQPETLDADNLEPDFLFFPFSPCKDTDNALKNMSELARSKHFQLYFCLQPEWDEVFYDGMRDNQIQTQLDYLNGFTDSRYVHIANLNPQVFGKSQFQNPQHLRPETDKLYTEAYTEAIAEIQNKLTGEPHDKVVVSSIKPDKQVYNTGDIPVIDFEITCLNEIPHDGYISCLVRHTGSDDGDWEVRASAVPFCILSNDKITVRLYCGIGELRQAGNYDLVVFLRQDISGLSNETRLEFVNEITVDSPGTGTLNVQTDPPVPATIYVDGIERNTWGAWADLLPGLYRVSFGELKGFIAPIEQTVEVMNGKTTKVVGQYITKTEEGPKGMLTVKTVPELPSVISLNGFPRDCTNINLLKLPSGSYSLSFSSISGYQNPEIITVTMIPGNESISQPINEPVIIKPGITTNIVANFNPLGHLKVITSPPVPATIFVDGNPMDTFGIWTDILPGDHLVSFGALQGYLSPELKTVTIKPWVTTEVIGDYENNKDAPGESNTTQSKNGALIVETRPSVPSIIYLDGIPRDNYGLDWLPLSPGEYTLSLSDVNGFQKSLSISVIDLSDNHMSTQPMDTPIHIYPDISTKVIVNFIPTGNLRITTVPAIPTTIFVNGNPMDTFGIWTYFPQGTYTISFQPISGYLTPPQFTVSVAVGKTTHVIADFGSGETRVMPD
jgi:hypothetical protein